MRELGALSFLVLVAGNQIASPGIREADISAHLPAIPSPSSLQTGEVVQRNNQYGGYYQYLPTSLSPASDIIVIVHGTPGANETALQVASVFIRRWVDLAEEKSAILVAPAFDQRNFASKEGGFGGYRGLFGREIGADEFVHSILDDFDEILSPFDGRFFLYGHSAGGQFVNRYVVSHPDRIKAAVISAAGRFTYPNSNVEWPYGMTPIQRVIEWTDPGHNTHVDITRDRAGWLQAAQLPMTVVVGDRDTDLQPQRPGHTGRTRIEFAQNWVNEMNSFANANGKVGVVRYVLVPGVGHDSRGLTPVCQEELFR